MESNSICTCWVRCNTRRLFFGCIKVKDGAPTNILLALNHLFLCVHAHVNCVHTSIHILRINIGIVHAFHALFRPAARRLVLHPCSVHASVQLCFAARARVLSVPGPGTVGRRAAATGRPTDGPPSGRAPARTCQHMLTCMHACMTPARCMHSDRIV